MAITWKAGRDFDTDYSTTPATHTPKSTYDGKVVGFHVDRSVRIMSDVWEDLHYAEVWDDSTQSIKRVHIGTTGWDFEGAATVDASPEDMAKAHEYRVAQLIKTYHAENERRINSAVERATTVEKGKEIEVVRGRKVPIGTRGECFWMGENRWGVAVGIRLANGEAAFTAITNVIVAQPDEYYYAPELPTDADMDARARRELAEAAKFNRAA